MPQFKGVIEMDVRDSVPDWEPYVQPKAPDGAPNVLLIVWDDVGYGAMDDLRRADRDADACAHRRCRPALLELPHDRALLADPIERAERPQRDQQQHGLHHGGRRRLPRLLGADPVRERLHLRGAQRARLEHLRVGKWHLTPAEESDLSAWKGRWPLGRGLRALLRVPRRRDQPVVSRPRLRQPPGRPARPPEEGYHLSKDLADQASSSSATRRRSPRQAVVHVLLPRRGARAAPRRQGVGGPLPGPLRRGLRGDPPRRSWPARRAGSAARGRRAVADQPARRARRDQSRRPAVAGAGLRAPVGLADRGRADSCSRGWPRSTPASSPTPTTRSAG